MAVIAALRIAPVKGLATVETGRVVLEAGGVPEDRRVFLIDAHGEVVTLRTRPHLVRATPDLDLDRRALSIALDDGSTAMTSLDDAQERVEAELYGKARSGRVLPGAVAEALSGLAGEPIRVVLGDDVGVGWDEGPVSIIGSASAAEVGGEDRDRARYRMLIEVDGTAPYEEDTWLGRDLAVGEARVRVTHRLVRCSIITQSPRTGAKDWDGLKQLAARRGPELCLGVIADVVRPGAVEIGDPVALA